MSKKIINDKLQFVISPIRVVESLANKEVNYIRAQDPVIQFSATTAGMEEGI